MKTKYQRIYKVWDKRLDCHVNWLIKTGHNTIVYLNSKENRFPMFNFKKINKHEK
jgi:hypothetical protein